MTGRRIPANEALQLGFVNEVVPHTELLHVAQNYAEEILACSPTALRAVTAVSDAFEGSTLAAAMEDTWTLPEVQAVFVSPDSREGPLAFAQRRSPKWSSI